MGNQPLKKYKAGSVSATVWENTGKRKNKEGKEEEFTFKTVNVERNYLDKKEEWQTTGNMRVNDLPKVALVANQAYEYLTLSETPELLPEGDPK